MASLLTLTLTLTLNPQPLSLIPNPNPNPNPNTNPNANQAQLARMLAEIVRLSKVRLAHSANQDVPIKFFHTARDDHNNLRDVLLNAILDDCRTTNQV